MSIGDTTFVATGPSKGKATIKATEKIGSNGACIGVDVAVSSPAGLVEIQLDRLDVICLHGGLGHAISKGAKPRLDDIEEARAMVAELRDELHDLTVELRRVRRERDEAMSALAAQPRANSSIA